MQNIKIIFTGTGDAFAEGGRYNTCFHVETSDFSFLIDCGASSLISMRKYCIDPSNLDAIFISHFHGDHIGGIPFILSYISVMSERSKPLLICGPEGIEEKVKSLNNLMFPGLSKSTLEIQYREYKESETFELEKIRMTPYKAVHTPETNPHSLRFEVGDKVITYSGDTEWNNNLIEASAGADLFICECNFLDEQVEGHIDYMTLKKRLPELKCKRIILTHMEDKMLEMENTECMPEMAKDGQLLYL
jgi:ribonuclease BN (tRNA processing enzyme)